MALARVGKARTKAMVRMIKTMATRDRRLRLAAKSRMTRSVAIRDASSLTKKAQNVSYVIGVVPICTRIYAEKALKEYHVRMAWPQRPTTCSRAGSFCYYGATGGGGGGAAARAGRS